MGGRPPSAWEATVPVGRGAGALPGMSSGLCGFVARLLVSFLYFPSLSGAGHCWLVNGSEDRQVSPGPHVSGGWGTYTPTHTPTLLFCSNIYFLMYIYILINLFLAVLGLRWCARAFSSCGERGLLFFAVCGLLTAVASLVAEHGL